MPLDAIVPDGRALVPILFYRSMLLAGDAAPVAALAAALEARGIAALPVFVREPARPGGGGVGRGGGGRGWRRRRWSRRPRSRAARSRGADAVRPARVPVFQVVPATTRREAWADGQRGLAPADLAMHVVLPELDGRILAGAVSFKAAEARDDALGAVLQVNRPEPGLVAQVARTASRRFCGCRRRRGPSGGWRS